MHNLHRCLAAAVVVVLAGCATARVSDATHASPQNMRPVEILVDVSTEAFGDAAQAGVAESVRADLQADLIKELTAARIFAEPLGGSALQAGAAVLHVTITEAEPGNAMKRLVIGLGSGRAKLQAAAELRTVGDPALVSFNTSSDSGKKPGLIVPGGIALATGKAAHLAILGGVDVALNTQSGFERPLKATARTMLDQLKKYYGSVGWYWPTSDRDQRS